MATPLFNNAETNSLLKIEPAVGGMVSTIGAPGLSAGTAVVTMPGPVAIKRMEFSPVGSNWTASRVTGKGPRIVTWGVQFATVDAAAMNKVVEAIEKYLEDGREYILTDGKGRATSAPTAILLPEGTGPRPLGFMGQTRKTAAAGKKLERWVLRFLVLRPVVSDTEL